jgi:hypothetical protein
VRRRGRPLPEARVEIGVARAAAGADGQRAGAGRDHELVAAVVAAAAGDAGHRHADLDRRGDLQELLFLARLVVDGARRGGGQGEREDRQVDSMVEHGPPP